MTHVANANRETSADIQARITPLDAQRKRVTADLPRVLEKLEAARDSYGKGHGSLEALRNHEGDAQALEGVLEELDAEFDALKASLKEARHREYLHRADAAVADAKARGAQLIIELDGAVQEFSRAVVEPLLREIRQAEEEAGSQLVRAWKGHAHGPTNLLRDVATRMRDYRQWKERQDLRRRRA